MKLGINYWLKSKTFGRIAWLVAFTLLFNPIAMGLIPFSPLNRVMGTSIAQAAVADQDGLGAEGFWSFFSSSLSAGWMYSINTFSGNLIIQKELLEIPGWGTGLHEGLVYNSLSSQAGVVGTGWQLESDLFVRENADGSVTFKDEDATNHTFTQNPDGSYKAPDGIHLELTKVNATTLTVKDEANATFSFQNGLLASITDEKGNVTSYSYDTNSRPTTVTDPSARTLSYSYDANGKLSAITDPASRTVSFSYDASGKLTSVTDPNGAATSFAYDGTGRLASVTDANGRITSFFYGGDGSVVKVKDPRSTQQKEFATTIAYDLNLRKTTVTDLAGKSTIYTHNAAGNATQIQNGAGDTVSLTWDKNSLLQAADASGTTSATYNNSGNLTSISDTLYVSSNATTTIDYDGNNNPTAITDPNGNQVTASYDEESNILSTGNPVRKEADANTYDAYGNVTSSTEPGAPTHSLLYNASFERKDASGKPEFWYLGGTTSAISVDSTVAKYGNASAKITSNKSITAYLYSQSASVVPGQKLTLNVPIKMSNVTGTGGVSVGLEYYDNASNFKGSSYSNIYVGYGDSSLTVTSDAPAGATKVIAVLQLYQAKGTVWFDGAQLEFPINDAEEHILTRFEYVENSSFEAGTSFWTPGGVTGATTISDESPWQGTYSTKINLTSSGTAWVKGSSIAVRAGEPLTLSAMVKTTNIVGSGARAQVQYYDANNNYLGFEATELQAGTKDYTRYAVSVTPPTGATSAVVYGAVFSSTGTAYLDNLKLVPRSTTKYEYDANANYNTAIVDPLGNRATSVYDTAGNRTQVTDPKGNATHFAYDTVGNLTSVTDALGKVSRYGYDPVSMQIAYRDARSSGPEDNTYKTLFGYNEIDQLVSTTDPLGRETTSTYDDAANLIATNQPNGKKVIYEYDSANRISRKSYSAEATTYAFSYDQASNLTQVQDNNSRSYQHTYDKANRLTSITDIFGYQQNFSLDKAGNKATVTDSNNKQTTYGYGSANQLIAITDPSGRITKFRYDEEGRPFNTIKGNGVKSITLYDEAGRVKEIADLGNPGSIVLNYAYDGNGNITTASGADGEERFAYDALNRLTSWRSTTGAITTYEYDAVGNLTKKGSKTYAYNAANEITNTGFSYDQNGNITSDGNFNYEYDSENRLTRVTKVSDGSEVARYEYNHEGLRISKTTPSGTIRYHWDDKDRLVRESDASGSTIALYTYDNKGQLISIEKGGATYYTHTNHRGDILAITDVNKNRVATYKYGPWGEFISKTGSFDIPFRYAGYYFDSETGLYYLKARYYSPELGRFLTKDTFEGFNEDPQSLNLYAYCMNNPIKYIDPTGRYSVSSNSYGIYLHTSASEIWGTSVGSYLGYVQLQLRQLSQQFPPPWGAFILRLTTIVGIFKTVLSSPTKLVNGITLYMTWRLYYTMRNYGMWSASGTGGYRYQYRTWNLQWAWTSWRYVYF